MNLKDYQFKTSRYSYRSTFMYAMVTANQKPTINAQNKGERNTSKPLKKVIKLQGKKLKRKEQENLQKQLENK